MVMRKLRKGMEIMGTDILVIEDNLELRILLMDFLKKAGYTCQGIRTGEEALAYLETNAVRLILLDIMLPGVDGFYVCSKIREKKNVPLLLVSAKTEKEDKLSGLIVGADDYIEKPYDIDILLAKIKRIFERYYHAVKETVLEDGNVRLDSEKRAVFVDGKEMSLTVKECELMRIFLENKGKTLNKEWLFDKVWGTDSDSEMSTLPVHIKWLRQKLNRNENGEEKIRTVWGVGYRYE